MKAEVKYQCPNWEFCNEQSIGMQAGKRCCRFCQKSRGKAYCCLHDEQLHVHSSGEIDKCKTCLGQTRKVFGKPAVQFIDTTDASPKIDPKEIVNATVNDFVKLLNKLRKEGYPIDLAIKLAVKTVRSM
jgi:hypothetical protein